ncbi:glutaminyl-peptide cyclotransferase [Stackebrandtia soli]|uniref:glutaminyl-peptide cyclotransferase n=1 Tax=Stackebrandtia soli TaxID=1892856 RepID=UPI0039E82541
MKPRVPRLTVGPGSRELVPRLVAVVAVLVVGLIVVVVVRDGFGGSAVPRWSLTELASAPRDSGVTQGLEIHDGRIYHSVGGYGSSLVRVEALDGSLLAEDRLPDAEYAEGLTVVGDVLWQLTWREGVAYRRDAATLAVLDRVRYDGEGWGLCHDATSDRLVMSDGSGTLSLRDPSTFAETGELDVTSADGPVSGINELECVDGGIWANRYGSAELMRVDGGTGAVDAIVEVPEWSDAGDLNGIAWVAADRFWLTGKNWPTRHLVAITPPASRTP